MAEEMTKFTSILIFFASLNILLQVNGKIVPNIQKYPTGITWEKATKSCGENGLEYDYNALKNVTGVVFGAEFWIGLAVYRVLTPWIEIIGCYFVPSTTDRKTMKSISLCKRFCETDRYIGYKNITKICVCLGDNIADRNHIQIDNCTKEMNNAFFVYKELGDGVITTDPSTDGNCISLCCPSCNGRGEKQETDCNAKNANIATRCEFMLDSSRWGQTYSEAMKLCFSKNRLLIPPTFCQNNSDYPGRTMWTNIFRDEREEKLTQEQEVRTDMSKLTNTPVTATNRSTECCDKKPFRGISGCELEEAVCRIVEDKGGNSSPVRCLTGVLHQQEDKLMLNITERDCKTKIKYFVCIASRPDSTSTQSDLSSPSLRKNTTYEATATKNYEGIIAGIAVITIGLLSGLAVLIVCRVRSLGVFKHINRKHEDFSSMKYESSNIPQKVENIIPTSNNTYGLVVDNSHDTYAKVKKKVNLGVPIVTSDDTYVESSYGEYDRLNVTNKRKVNPDENTYDSNAGVRDMADPTYDTSKFNDRKLRESDMYDHSFQGGNSDYDYSSSHILNINEGIYDKSQ